ncbi:PRC-barrel domain-containing protein [Streptomyces sp. HPF1205]|uniref:PRC-barrel domain-containing protein n=1 Tax=Streptomyces sp. HPF1205 TaxID=2873262 RepID=UPI001CEDD9EA|nr:PRC-barrel domain-containing protein [Streptomyces sp. HPF1205]
MITREQIPRIVGHPVYDAQGKRIGPAKHMYLDDATGDPVWVTVRTGFLGKREIFVPTGAARVVEDHLEVPFVKEKVKGAPTVALDTQGHLSADQERRLYGYYGLEAAEPSDAAAGTGRDQGDTSAPTTMSGSEAGVGTGQVPEGDWAATCGPGESPVAGRKAAGTGADTGAEAGTGAGTGTPAEADRPGRAGHQRWPEAEMGPGTGRRPEDPDQP